MVCRLFFIIITESPTVVKKIGVNFLSPHHDIKGIKSLHFSLVYGIINKRSLIASDKEREILYAE